MKIVNICAHYQDKLGYQEHYLGKEWVKMGYDVHYITSDVHFDFPDYNNTVKSIIGDKYVGTGVFYTDFNAPIHRLKSAPKKYTGLMWLVGLKKKVLELKPDILVIHGIFNYQTIRVLYFVKKIGCKVIIDDHTAEFFVRKGKIADAVFWLFRALFSKHILKVADKIVAITPSVVDVMRNKFGISGVKVEMIPLGSDIELFRKSREYRKRGREYFNLDDEDILVLYTGKIYPDKKVHLIIDALNDPNVNCSKNIVIGIVGNMSIDYKEFMNEAIKNAVCRVVLLNAVSQAVLPLMYNAADICVWPDSLTTSTIDASACGSPIICSDNMPERTIYGNGILIKGGDIYELKIALRKLIDDAVLRLEMGQKGVKYVEDKLSWRIIAQRFLD